jgi:hypothetical protein
VVLHWPWPEALPVVAAEIGALVRGAAGEREVTVTVADVATGGHRPAGTPSSPLA